LIDPAAERGDGDGDGDGASLPGVPARHEADGASPEPPGLTRFTLGGRSAPGLFVLGWAATILGLSITLTGFLSGADGPGFPLFFLGTVVLSAGLGALAGSQTLDRRAAWGPAAEAAVDGTPTASRWTGPSPVLLFLLSMPAAYVVAVAVGLPLAVLGVGLSRPAAELLLVILQALVYVGLVRLLVVGPGAATWSGLGLRGPIGRIGRDLTWGGLYAVPIIMVTAALSWVLVTLIGEAPTSPLEPTSSLDGLVLHLVAGAVVAPFSEELIFRGVAVSAWRPSVGSRGAILRSALLFAFAHVLLVGGSDAQQALGLATVGFLGRLPVALALGWIYVRTGSLWTSIGLHAGFNAVLVILADTAAGIA
jgi:membrane protease YdiL (CAAX protease family)